MNPYTATIAAMPTGTLCALAAPIIERYDVKIVRDAEKTLCMAQVREPVAQSLFYLGELLCVECTLTVDGVEGMSVLLGDDMEKVRAAAVLDAAFHAGLPEVAAIKVEIAAAATTQSLEKRALARRVLKSKVDFRVMP